MAESLRLSDASQAAVKALASFDYAALEALTDRLKAAARGELPLEQEPIDLIHNNQQIFAGILMSTEQNLALLRRLRERKAGNEWAL